MHTIIKRVRRAIMEPFYFSKLKNDVRLFEEGKLENNDKDYLNMISSFCASGGSSMTKMASFISSKYPKSDISPLQKDSIFNLDLLDFRHIVNELNSNGYFVLPQKISEEIINQLLSFAKNEPCDIRITDGAEGSVTTKRKIDFDNLESIIYSVAESSSINNELVAKLATDYVFLKIAQDYLNVDPIWDVTTFWWSTNYSNKADKNAAQWYHFDMDRLKWLKVFIYLTDVSADDGPHTFVIGSSRDGGIPMNLLGKGYFRLSDQEVESQYNKDKFIEFVAKKGTIIIEDTRGLHKGKNVVKGPRCLLQFQYSNSLFGANYPKVKINMNNSSSLAAVKKIIPRLFSNYQ